MGASVRRRPERLPLGEWSVVKDSVAVAAVVGSSGGEPVFGSTVGGLSVDDMKEGRRVVGRKRRGGQRWIHAAGSPPLVIAGAKIVANFRISIAESSGDAIFAPRIEVKANRDW